MTAPATTRRAGPFNGNGATTSFPFTFKVFAASDIAVVKTSTAGLDTTLVLASDYSVSLNADQDTSPGGTITYPVSGTALAVGEKLTAVGSIPYDQTADLPTGGNYRAVVVENALDRTVFQVQQLAEELGRSLTLPASAATADTELPAPEAGKVIGWNATADALVNLDAGDLASVVIAGTSYTDLFDGTGAQTAFALTANPGGVNALDVSISGVVQVNGVDFTVSGTTLTFTAAPPAGTDNIAVRYSAAIPTGTADAQDVAYGGSDVAAALDDIDARVRVSRNILPNTRWLVATALNVAAAIGTKYNVGATGTVAVVNVSSYTTGANTVVCACADTSNVVVGGLIVFNAPAHANLRLSALRVQSVVANTSFTVRLPLGLTAASSAICVAFMATVGANASVGTGNSFDGWSKAANPNLEVWREEYSANLQPGAKYACGMKKASASAELHYVQIDARDVDMLRGRTISVGGFIKAPAGGTWRAFIAHSSGTANGTTVITPGYSWSEVSTTIPAAATSISVGFELIGASGLTFYLSQPYAGQGNIIGSTGGPPDLSRERLIPTVKFSPLTMVNANVTLPTTVYLGSYGFYFDPYAETNGALAPECRALDILIEGYNANAVLTTTNTRALATRDQLDVPHKYGPIMFQQVADVKHACGGTLTLGTDGTAVIYGNVSADNWANFSVDINGVIL